MGNFESRLEREGQLDAVIVTPAAGFPSHEDLVHNIRAAYCRATKAQVTAGRRWYPTARKIVGAIADATGTDSARVTYAMAALSPRNPWRWNVQDTYAFALAASQGQPMPKATTFGRNQRTAWTALATGSRPWTGAALKVTNFVAAIHGDKDAVVLDVWAVRAATNGAFESAGSAKRYATLERAYWEVADGFTNLGARDLQAIVWLVVQAEGNVTHSAGFKTGTADLVKELLA